jgi:hypothetical protein
VTTAQDVLTSSADFAALQAEVMHGLMRAFGTPSPTLAGFGLSHDKGFALFVVDGGQVVMVLPVGDRDRFVAALEGRKGADGDVVASWACQTIGGRYVCAQRRGLLAKLGRGGLDAVRRSAAARGEIEIAGRGLIEPVGRSFAAVAELDRGTVILRGTVEAASLVTDLLGAPGRPRADAVAAAGFGVVDPVQRSAVRQGHRGRRVDRERCTGLAVRARPPGRARWLHEPLGLARHARRDRDSGVGGSQQTAELMAAFLTAARTPDY